MKTFKEILNEALTQTDISNSLNKYLSKVGNSPTARDDFLMQVASFLGRKANISPEELDVALRQHYAKNYDPAKVARGQTPVQRAQQQAKVNPPPIPGKTPRTEPVNKKTDKEDEKPSSLPSLSSLAGHEFAPDWKDADYTPFWKKHNLPPPEAFKQNEPEAPKSEPEAPKNEPVQPKDEPKGKEPEDDDIPMADPKDVRAVGSRKAANKSASKALPKAKEKEKEIDMDKFGDLEPDAKEKPEKNKADSGKSKKKKGGKKKIRQADTEAPTEPSSFALPNLKDIEKINSMGDPKWKSGKAVNVPGRTGTFNVKGKTGSWYNLEKDGEKYIYVPFKGLRKLKR